MSDIELIRNALAALDALAGSPLPGEPTHIVLRNALRERLTREERERTKAAEALLPHKGYAWDGSAWVYVRERPRPGGIVETYAHGVPLKPTQCQCDGEGGFHFSHCPHYQRFNRFRG